MIRELTEDEKAMIEYSNTQSYKETMNKFHLPYWKINNLRRKQPKYEKNGFVQVDIKNRPTEPEQRRNAALHIGRSEIVMSVTDFRKAFIDD